MQSSTPHSRRVVVALLAAAACGSPASERTCRIDGECLSGRCGSDGVCVPVSRDAGPYDGAAANRDGGDDDRDGGLVADRDGGVDDGGTVGCRPNQDGRIEASELPFAADRQANFRISTDVDPFDGTLDCSGPSCGWDFVDVGGQTVEAIVDTSPLSGQWFAGDAAFATASYSAIFGAFEVPFVCQQIQIGVYRHDDDGLWLLGIVSEQESDGTKLVFNPPVAVLDYPLEAAKTWMTDTVARGPLCNSLVDFEIRQTWTSEVDATGFLETPYGRFEDVLRVNTAYRRFAGVGVTPTRARTHTYVAECFTTVATVSSEDGDDTIEIAPAQEVRRLAPF